MYAHRGVPSGKTRGGGGGQSLPPPPNAQRTITFVRETVDALLLSPFFFLFFFLRWAPSYPFSDSLTSFFPLNPSPLISTLIVAHAYLHEHGHLPPCHQRTHHRRLHRYAICSLPLQRHPAR